MADVIRLLLRELAALPAELARILLLLLLLLWRLIWSLLLFLLGRPWYRKDPPPDREKCHDKIPPHVRRKPDPCLYSQFYLMQQGVPVTWDNPDIWLTELDGTPVNSSQLAANHPYRVNGRIWDAAFDPALAVEVRCYFHDWGFNGARTPVETNPDGSERVVLLNIAPWSNAVAQFQWTTPPGGGHFCLKVECAHPDDRNTANNVGQENTDVRQTSARRKVTARAVLLNRFRRPARVMVTVDTYQLPDQEWEFPIQTQVRELAEAPMMVQGADIPRAGDEFQRWLRGRHGRGPRTVRYAYLGREALFQAQRAAPASVPRGWTVTVDGREADTPLTLAAGERREVELGVQVPAGAQPGERFAFNFNAVDPERGPLGGVTLTVEIE